MPEGDPLFSGTHEAAKITFADVPLGTVREIAKASNFARLLSPQELIEQGVQVDIIAPLVRVFEVPIFEYDPLSPRIPAERIQGWDLIRKIADDLGIEEDEIALKSSDVNRSAGLQQQVESFTSPDAIEGRNRFSLPTMFVESLEIDLPNIRRSGEGGGALVGSKRE